MSKEIFRKSAMKKLSSPEQLDKLLKIVGIRGWVVLLSLMGLMVAVGIWAFVAEIPVQVSGKAILYDPMHWVSIRTKVPGRVTSIEIQPGSVVHKGDILATLESLKGGEIPTKLIAPEDGVIEELNAAVGDQMDASEPIMWLRTSAAPRYVFAFLPVSSGDLVDAGMAAKVNLASVDSQKYGLLLGKVQNVFVYQASMNQPQLRAIPIEMRKYLVSEYPSVLVVVELEMDPSTVSGYKWTSPKGPPEPLSAGVFGEVKITIENRRPISYVIPGIE